ncbi:MAG: 2,3-bisphosphoglycerate-independent phosphoglycerate mutase [Deltaproteobacteria bacterium]|nr:MAG: 2,3-bisphosphoglycerate-independent phosphoglycerate mutase [Deltaproteobacteria bacterium]
MELKLKKHPWFRGRKGPLLLVIMDGIGLGPQDERNAVFMAKTPTLDRLFASKLFCRLQAHGTAVGLPTDKDMGNSEVGHNALGAGRVFDQGARLVNKAIETGKIFESELWQQIVERGKKGGTIHFIGLLSDGNVHSHIDHLYKLIDKCAELDLKRVRVHVLLDGRDVGEKSALNYVIPTEEKLAKLSLEKGLDYRIASGGGRMKVTMDRYEADWRIVKRGWDAHVLGKGRPFRSAKEAVETYYKEDPDITDQYLDSFVVVDEKGEPVGLIRDGDVVINFNFRGDRAIEISRAFTEKEFREFDRGPLPDVIYAGMMEYDGDLHIPPNFLVWPPAIDRTVSEYLCAEGVTSFAISETQKYGHVTYFWNGNRSGYIDEKLETYIEIPSDRIEFDKAPQMKALEITDKTIELLETGKFRFGRLNFANGDMVGHTGNMEAAITAVETVDSCAGRLIKVVNDLGGITVVTADHGNSDEMFTIDSHGNRKPKTAHTLNPVPFIIVDSQYGGEYEMAPLEKRGLSNVAATLLNLLGYEKVEDYDPSLIQFKH